MGAHRTLDAAQGSPFDTVKPVVHILSADRVEDVPEDTVGIGQRRAQRDDDVARHRRGL